MNSNHQHEMPPELRRFLEGYIDKRFNQLIEMVKKMAKFDDLTTALALVSAEAKDRTTELAAANAALALANAEIAALKAAPPVVPVDGATPEQVQAALDQANSIAATLAPAASQPAQ